MSRHTAITLKEGVYRFIANVEEEDIDLFEGIWPIPHGISMNSYFVQGDKGALVDLVCAWEGTPVKVLDQMQEMSFSVQDVHYAVLNHMEPDHTGFLPILMEKNPQITVVCTEKAAKLVRSFYNIDRIHTVKTGDTLDLGKGHVLHFVEIPNVHWPETMVTYDSGSRVLFTCDAFGGFGSIENAVFDDQLNEGEKRFFYEESFRYYVNIVGAFSTFVLRAIKKVEELNVPIDIIAPAHGIIWRKNPMEVVENYRKFATYMEGPCEREITLVWSSMYGNTEKLVQTIVDGVRSENVDINIFRVPQDHVSYILPAAYRSSALILGMPTYEYKMFPPMAYTIDMFGRKHVYNKKVLRFGSYGWSGGAQKEFEELIEKWKLKWELKPPIEWEGAPTEQTFKQAYEAAAALAREVKALVPVS